LPAKGGAAPRGHPVTWPRLARQILILLCTGPAFMGAALAQADADVDADGGGLDMGDFLLRQNGALPVPVIITEPAVLLRTGG
jgi:hypothetical protein